MLHNTKIYKIFHEKASNNYNYIVKVEEVCDIAINLSPLINNMFPLYTEHATTHIYNVLEIMAKLLDEKTNDLSIDEAALLLMVACWHDAGMAVNEKQKEKLLSEDSEDIWDKYFKNHNEDKIKYNEGTVNKELLLPNLIRSFHHKRIKEQLIENNLWNQWPEEIDRHITINELIKVCESHGEDIQIINETRPRSQEIDLRVCAILLRLADLLDIDCSRAPRSLYHYLGLDNPQTNEEEFSQIEWKKNMSSYGFDFTSAFSKKNIVGFSLPFNATCKDPVTYHKVNEYIDWVEHELSVCNTEFSKYRSKWEDKFILPYKVERNIHTLGFESGDFSFHLDKDCIIELLKGNNIYNNKGVFIRELIQNALDAVRTRRQIEKNNCNWEPKINIYSWTTDGFNWLSVDDNGIGMSREIIKNYFLCIGRSYYESNEFKSDFGNENYRPTSRFGIGILSCFIAGNDSNRIEVSTKHYQDTDGKETLQLIIPSQKGYYFLTSEADNRSPIMKEMDDNVISSINSLKKNSGYRKETGTTISVKFSIDKIQTYNAITIKDILDIFIAFPDVPIHYHDLDNNKQFDYMTEKDFHEFVKSTCEYDKNGFSKTFKYTLPNKIFDELKEYYPEAQWTDIPTFQTEFLHLKEISPFDEDPYIDGILMMAKGLLYESGICTFPQSKYAKVFSLSLKCKIRSHKVELFAIGNISDAVSDLLIHTRNKLITASARLTPESDAAEICSAILDGRYYKKKWRIKFSEMHGICESNLYDIAANALQNDIMPDDLQEYIVFQKYEYDWGWKYKFDIPIPFFKDFFYHIFSTGSDFLFKANRLSYNGIYIKEIVDYEFKSYGWNLVASNIILKDMHRPDLSVSRFDINNFPLKLTCMYATLQMHLKHARRDILHFERVYNFDATLDDFRKILHDSPSLMEYLYINTWGGSFRLFEINDRLKQGKPVILNIVHLDSMIIRLSIAVLLERFDVRFEINQAHYPVISVFLKDKQTIIDDHDSLKNFPPGLFLHTIDRKTKYLSAGTNNNCLVYNADHPFSKWLISNSNLLKEKSPDILKALCFCMTIGIVSENCDEKRINEINKILHLLKEHKFLNVPEIFLKSSDFLSLDTTSDK